MIETATKQGIVIREIVDETTIHKLDTRPLEKALESIELPSYGTRIEKILFIVVALPPGSTIHKDEVVYDRRKRQLTLELNLDYSQVVKGTSSEVLGMAAKLFLGAFDVYLQLKILGFNSEIFKNDAMQLLNSKGILSNS